MESVTLNPDFDVISQAKRGSLSETQYFIHLACRLHYLNDKEAEELIGQTKHVFACLHGLIQSVEKEAGKVGKTIAVATSILVLCVARAVSGQ